jgi:hypothetical protein
MRRHAIVDAGKADCGFESGLHRSHGPAIELNEMPSFGIESVPSAQVRQQACW